MRRDVMLGRGRTGVIAAFACVGVWGCEDGASPGTGGASTASANATTSSDAVSSSTGASMSCASLVVDPPWMQPAGWRQIHFAPWPGGEDAALIALESPPPTFDMEFPGDVWATRVYDPFGAAWPPSTLHERRITTTEDVGGFAFDAGGAEVSVAAFRYPEAPSLFRDVLGATSEMVGRGGNPFVVLPSRVLAVTSTTPLQLQSFGAADVVEEPPVPCVGYPSPLAIVRLPRSGSVVVVTRVTEEDDPNCMVQDGHILAIDRYDDPGDPTLPMVRTQVARLDVEGNLFDLTSVPSATGAWVVMRVDPSGSPTEIRALRLDADGAPVGTPAVAFDQWAYSFAAASTGETLVVASANDDDANANTVIRIRTVLGDGTLGPSTSVAAPGKFAFETTMMADEAGRGVLIGYDPSFGDPSGVVRVRCQ